MNAEVVKWKELSDNDVVAANLNRSAGLDSKSSFCALVENGNGGDGYSPRDFACPSEELKNCMVHVRLAA